MFGWRRHALEALVALGLLYGVDALFVTFTPWHARLTDLPLGVAVGACLFVAEPVTRFLIGPEPLFDPNDEESM